MEWTNRTTKSGEVVPVVGSGGCGELDILLRSEVGARRIQLTQTALSSILAWEQLEDVR